MSAKCSNCTNLNGEVSRLQRQVTEKSMKMDDLRAGTPEGIRTLMGQYPNLRKFLELLRYAANVLDDPQASPAPDKGKGGAVSKKSYDDIPSESDRFRGAMARKAAVGRKLDKTVFEVQDILGDNGPQPAHEKPRCRKKGCSLKDKRQEYGSFRCRECGEPMTEVA